MQACVGASRFASTPERLDYIGQTAVIQLVTRMRYVQRTAVWLVDVCVAVAGFLQSPGKGTVFSRQGKVKLRKSPA